MSIRPPFALTKQAGDAAYASVVRIDADEKALTQARLCKAVFTSRITGSTGRAVAYYNAQRRLIKVQNTSTTNISVGVASGAVDTAPSFTVTVTPGEEFIATEDSNPVWFKEASNGTAAVRVYTEEMR